MPHFLKYLMYDSHSCLHSAKYCGIGWAMRCFVCFRRSRSLIAAPSAGTFWDIAVMAGRKWEAPGTNAGRSPDFCFGIFPFKASKSHGQSMNQVIMKANVAKPGPELKEPKFWASTNIPLHMTGRK